jgi:hypothetical protein
MPGRLGPRFAIEALFLIALAVGVAYADLSRKWIAIVMAGGWMVVALVELTAERIWATAPPWRRPDYYAAPAPRREPVAAPPAPVAAEPKPAPQTLPEAEPEPVAAAKAEPVMAAEPEPVVAAKAEPEPEAATVIEPPERTEPEPEPEAEPEAEPAPIPTSRPKLEPLGAKPKRRWFRREHEEVPDETTEIPMPKHVRLLSPTERREGDTDEIAGLFDEENTSA